MKKLIILLLLIALSTAAVAEEDSFHPLQVGLVAYTGINLIVESMLGNLEAGYGVGCIVHASPRIALKPQIYVYRYEEEEENLITSTTDFDKDFAFGGALDALYYLSTDGAVSFYVGPGVGYASYTAERTTNSGARQETSYAAWQLRGILGAQVMLLSRFGFFADVAIIYRSLSRHYVYTNDLGVITTEDLDDSQTIGTQAPRLGAVFYLN